MPPLRNLLFTFLMQFGIRLPRIIGIHVDPDLQNWFNPQIKNSDPDPDPYRVWKLGGITVKVGVEAHTGDAEGL